MSVFLVLEVILLELVNIHAARLLDEASGMRLLEILAPGVVLPGADEIE